MAKYQTEIITQAAGTNAGTFTKQVKLDENFESCDGVQIIEITNGGIPYYSIGIDDKNNTYHSITHKKDWISGENVKLDDRYKSILIPIVDKLDIKINLPVPTITDIQFQIIFRLKKKDRK